MITIKDYAFPLCDKLDHQIDVVAGLSASKFIDMPCSQRIYIYRTECNGKMRKFRTVNGKKPNN